jgi:hypothetical protein
MRSLRRNSHRFLAARRMEGAVPSRFLRAVATAGAKHFGARYCWNISAGFGYHGISHGIHR